MISFKKHFNFIILHNKECNYWFLLKKDLENLIQEKNLDAEIKEILIENDKQAKKLKFSGSPQLLINGKDIDPMSEKIINYHAGGCRPILYQDKLYDWPPREMIEKAL